VKAFRKGIGLGLGDAPYAFQKKKPMIA